MKVYAIWDFYDTLQYSGGDEHLVGLVMTEEQASESCLRWLGEELRTHQLNGNDLDDLSLQFIKPKPDDPLENGLTIEIKDKDTDCVRYIRYEPIEVLDKPFPFGRIKSV